MTVRYTLLTLLQLVVTDCAYLLSPLIAWSANENGVVPSYLRWAVTFDASLDAGWRDGYFSHTGVPTGWALWWLRMRWIWRNPAYGFCYYTCGIPFDPSQWVVDFYKVWPDGTRDFQAHTVDGRYFNTETAAGAKYGWKAANYFVGLDSAGKPIWKTQPWGPDWRTMICFTPHL